MSFDPAGSKDQVKSKFLMISNGGKQPAEIQIVLHPFSRSNDTVIGSTELFIALATILNPGEFLSLPTSRLIVYQPGTVSTDPVGGTPTLESAANANTLSFTAVDENGHLQPVIADSPTTLDTQLSAAITSTTATTLTIDTPNARAFYKNDYIMLGSEIMFVTAAASDTTLTVERGALGTTAATHLDDANVYLYIGNVEKNDPAHSAVNTAINSSKYVMTSPKGTYHCSSFFGYGRHTAITGPQGIVPGSVAIKFWNGASQELGLSGQLSTTNTLLAANTEYGFDLSIDGTNHTSDFIKFTTDASNTTWGTKAPNDTGVLKKLQDAIDQRLDQQIGSCSVDIVNGDIIFTSLSNHQGSAVLLAAPSAGETTPFGVGIVPVIANVEDAKVPYVDDDEDTGFIMFDDGRGNLYREAGGSGKINYLTGTVKLYGCPPQANMEIAAKYKSALSGVEHGEANNSIALIKAGSTNAYRDAYVKVMTFDDTINDDNSAFLAGSSIYGGGRSLRVRDDGTIRKNITIGSDKRVAGGTGRRYGSTK
jgi:hypothetical protein